MRRHFLAPILPAVLFAALWTALWAGPATAETLLRRGNGAEPETLDPHKATGSPEMAILTDLFEGLVHPDAQGRPQPGLAERWTTSADGLRWTFHLRADARWSDGAPLTADDMAFSLKRATDPTFAARNGFLLAMIDAVDAPDPQTLSISLKYPTPYLLQVLTHPIAYPVPKQALAAHGEKWTRPGALIGNGAFKLVAWTPHASLRLDRNPHARDAKSIALDAVVYLPTEDRAAELKRYRAGELDVAYEAPADQISWIKANLPQELRLTPFLSTYFYAFNLTNAPFRDQTALRRALSMVIDRDILTEKILAAGERPAYGLIPPGLPDYAPVAADWAAWPAVQRIEKAQALLRTAGYGPDKPLKVELLYNTSDNHRRIAVAIQAMWRKHLGVEATLRNEEWKSYLASRAEKRFQILRMGWVADYADPYSFLELFRTDIGEQNITGWSDAAFDSLTERAANTQATGARMALLAQAEARLLEQAPLVPLYFYVSKRLVKPTVRGWIDNPLDMHPSRHLSLVAR